MLELPWPETAGRVAKLERPQEIAGLLEVGSDGVDLVNEILHTHDAVLAEALLDDSVVGKGDALLVDLAVSALVNELADGLEVGVAVGDEGLDNLKHFESSLGQSDEDAIVDLEESEKLESLALLGINLVDTVAKFRLCPLLVDD